PGGRLADGGADIPRSARTGFIGDGQGRSRHGAAVANGERAGTEIADVEIAAVGPGRADAIDCRGAGRCGKVADIAGDVAQRAAVGDGQRGVAVVTEKEVAGVGPGRAATVPRHG